MDFDEYDYLEKTVEKPDLKKKDKESANGDASRSEEKERRRSSKHRSEDSDRDADHHRSKRSRSEDERPRDRERDRHRSSREREERNGIEKDRKRDRDHMESERERSRRSSSRTERHRSERDKDAERDRDREKSRDRNREKSRDRNREKSRDMELRERERERELKDRDRDRDGRRYKEKKEEVAEPEADPERDQRTVFAFQICLKADERDVYEFFSRAGKVRDVRLIMDRNSRRSKGVGYIEFYDAMSVPMAIALSGQPLLGQPVMVKPSEAEKNLVQSNTAAGGAGGLIGPYSGGARRLYIGNLHSNMTEDQLRQVFEPFGTVELVQLPPDDAGHCKGFGFVQFARLEDARAAVSLDGQIDIAGRTIKVSAVSDQAGMQDVGANAGDFDDDDGRGLALNARSRAELMQKLDRSGTTLSISGSLSTPVVNGPAASLPTTSILGVAPAITPLLPGLGGQVPTLAGLPGAAVTLPVATTAVDTIGVPSECLLLKNMFDPQNETEPDFELDIKDDVQDECSKFGTVKHIFVEKNSAGFVYLRFGNVQSAASAQRALHGRWFAGKMITATFMLPQNYEANEKPTSLRYGMYTGDTPWTQQGHRFYT
ncbi:RNA recognition motif domain-containing protein [Cinnamomum micranthum f. kanehirae]|uniref:RNA recognition motif domain-containing protein n=1 Tax=Cinnamomum micranthum f. kanehirae TaxID=337451 RepID=A0A3S3QXX5_9MAGN|nr:RNA recognition motif domain-containing protein [Cinnamomum micranthum f. kanehirae]